MWCGVVWCGVVWCGVVWCGVVWCGVVWCGVVWCGVVWCGVVWCDLMFKGNYLISNEYKNIQLQNQQETFLVIIREFCYPLSPHC